MKHCKKCGNPLRTLVDGIFSGTEICINHDFKYGGSTDRDGWRIIEYSSLDTSQVCYYEVAEWKDGNIIDDELGNNDGEHFDNLENALEYLEEQLEESK